MHHISKKIKDENQMISYIFTKMKIKGKKLC